MPVLINQQTGLAENLPQEIADQSIKGGSHALPLNDPEGNPVVAPVEQAGELLSQGYSQPTPEQLGKLVKHAGVQSTEQKVKAFTEGALEAATFGLSTAAEVGLGIAKPEDIEARRETGAHTAGTVAGLVGSALIPFGEAALLGKAGTAAARAVGLAEKTGVVNRIASSAVKGAFENMLYAAGEEHSKMWSQNPDQTAETAFSNIGLSAVLGGLVGGGFGAVEGAIGKYIPKVVSEVDKPKIEAGDIATAAQYDDHIAPSVKRGLFDSLKSERPDAAEIRSAAQEIGAPVLPGMTSDQKMVRRGVDSLLNGPPTWSGIEMNKAYKQGYDIALKAVEGATDAASPYTKAELGNVFKESLTSKLSEDLQPIQQLYNELKQTTDAIPISDRSGPAIMRNLWKSEDFRMANISPSSPQAKLLRRVGDEIGNLKTVDDIKLYKTGLRQELNAMSNTADRYAVSKVIDKLTNLEENSVIRFAKTQMKTPEAKARIMGLIDMREAANAQYKQFMEKVSTLSERLGKSRVYGPQDAINFIRERLTPEEITDKLFSKKDSEFLNFFKKEFPEEMKMLAEHQRQALRESASQKGFLDPKVLFNKVNKLEPEIKAHLFEPDQLKKLTAAEKYIRSMPESFNPSGTDHMSAFREFFKNPTGAVLANARDLAIDKFVRFAEHYPEVSFAKKLADHAIAGESALNRLTKAAVGIGNLAPLAATRLIVPESKREKLKKQIDEFTAEPEKMLNINSPHNRLEEVSTAQGRVASSALSYLAQFKPDLQKKAPLDGEPVASSAAEAKYNRALDIAENPTLALMHIANGTLTTQDVATVRNIYPNLHSAISQKLTHGIVEAQAKGKIIPYNTRLSIAMFLGQPLDSTMNPSGIQATNPGLAPQPMQAPMAAMYRPGAQPQSSGGGRGSMKNINKLPSMYSTPGQSREQEKGITKI